MLEFIVVRYVYCRRWTTLWLFHVILQSHSLPALILCIRYTIGFLPNTILTVLLNRFNKVAPWAQFRLKAESV